MKSESKLPKDNFVPARQQQKGQKRPRSQADESTDSDAESGVAGAAGPAKSSKANGTTESCREQCPICLSSFRDQDWARPEVCMHKFCLEYLLEWSKVTKNTYHFKYR